MTKEQLAQMLDGREYPLQISGGENLAAAEHRLVVVYGESDDLCELRGAIYGEVGGYGGLTVLLGKGGAVLPNLEGDDREVLKRHGVFAHVLELRASATKIQAHWDRDGYSWVMETEAPHATFDVLEDGEKYCRGIVIDLKELAK